MKENSIYSIEEMDSFLSKLDSAIGDDEMREIFNSLPERYDLNVPNDPFSIDYRKKQFDLYRYVSGKEYSIQNEVTIFDVGDSARNPFPYCHRSSELVGNQFLAIGFLIKAMRLPPGARILEFGPGWGNTTIALAKMGYHVTAVDIEQNFIDLINRRAEMENLSVNTIRGDFSLIENMDEKFDAILFFECFHHAQDHLRLMENFDKVLNKKGMVCFAAEPISEDFPIPWGLRMDGQSIWAIRRNGWLELGFNIRYFVNALRRNGFVAHESVGVDGPWSRVIIASRLSESHLPRVSHVYSFGPGGLLSQAGRCFDKGILLTESDHGVAVYGPYKEVGKGNWEAVISFGEGVFPKGSILVDIVHRRGDAVIYPQEIIDLSPEDRNVVVNFSVSESILDFEIRVIVTGGCSCIIEKIVINSRWLDFQ